LKSQPVGCVSAIPSSSASSGCSHPPSGQPLPSAKEGRGPDAGSLSSFRCRAHSSDNRTSWVTGLLRLLVGGAFVFAGALKIADPAKFALDVGNYRLVPHEFINVIAILLPWIEVVAGAFVLAGIWLRDAALVITAMTVMFMLVILSALARGLNIECGCFGTVGGKHVGLVNLALDATLFSLAAILARRSKDRAGQSNTRTNRQPIDVPGADT